MIQYYTQKRRKLLKISFLILLIMFSLLLATLTYNHVISYSLCVALVMINFMIVIIASQKSGRISVCDGHIVTIGDSQYDLNHSLHISKTRQGYEFHYTTLSIRVPFSHHLLKNVQIENIPFVSMQLVHFWKLFLIMVLLICFCYQVFCILLGVILLIKGYQLLLPSLLLMRVVSLIFICVGFLSVYLLKERTKALYVFILLGIGAIILPMSVSLKTYSDFYGDIYCQAYRSQLKVYAYVQGEYGLLKKTFKDIQKYEMSEWKHKQILFYQQDHVASYLVYPETSQMTVNEILKPFQGKKYKDKNHSLSFISQGVMVDGELCSLKEIEVVKDYMLKINGASELVYIYLRENQYHQDVEVLFPFEMPSFLSVVSQDTSPQSSLQPPTPQTQPEETTPQQTKQPDVQSYQAFLKAVKKAQTFTSNQTIVKIKTSSQDQNKIVKEVAKTLTIMNNDKNIRVDTQILKIEIIAGDALEFVAHVDDRQDRENEEKQLHNYTLRIKKVDNSYIGVRVEDNMDISMDLKSLKEPIVTDTSFSTDYLYCIQGKEEVDGW